MEKIKLHADVRALRRSGKCEFAKFFVVTEMGGGFWQERLGRGGFWCDGGNEIRAFDAGTLTKHGPFAIDLTTGDIHIDGVKVPQSVWVAARKRKGRAR